MPARGEICIVFYRVYIGFAAGPLGLAIAGQPGGCLHMSRVAVRVQSFLLR